MSLPGLIRQQRIILFFENVGHLPPVEAVEEGMIFGKTVQSGAVTQNMPDSGFRFAGGSEFRPVTDHGGVVIQTETLRKNMKQSCYDSLSDGKKGKQRTKCPLFSEMELLFSKNVVSFAMTFFLFNKKVLNNERK